MIHASNIAGALLGDFIFPIMLIAMIHKDTDEAAKAGCFTLFVIFGWIGIYNTARLFGAI